MPLAAALLCLGGVGACRRHNPDKGAPSIEPLRAQLEDVAAERLVVAPLFESVLIPVAPGRLAGEGERLRRLAVACGGSATLSESSESQMRYLLELPAGRRATLTESFASGALPATLPEAVPGREYLEVILHGVP